MSQQKKTSKILGKSSKKKKNPDILSHYIFNGGAIMQKKKIYRV